MPSPYVPEGAGTAPASCHPSQVWTTHSRLLGFSHWHSSTLLVIQTRNYLCRALPTSPSSSES